MMQSVKNLQVKKNTFRGLIYVGEKLLFQRVYGRNHFGRRELIKRPRKILWWPGASGYFTISCSHVGLFLALMMSQ
jgi:hypothetical protein